MNPLLETDFFWDMRIQSLDKMVLEPIQNHVEMGLEKLEDLEDKLNEITYYPALFEGAFGDSEITKERIASGLSQFLKSMVSHQSKFDRAYEEGSSVFSEKEKDGRQLFNSKARCYHCHDGANFNESADLSWQTQPKIANIGLDENYTDLGVGTYDADRVGEFKIPSLRNVELTAPYMHDGRFNTLMEVVEHYNSQIQAHPNLDERLMKNGAPFRMELSEYEKEALVAYLTTLTDEEFIRDERFSSPFE